MPFNRANNTQHTGNSSVAKISSYDKQMTHTNVEHSANAYQIVSHYYSRLKLKTMSTQTRTIDLASVKSIMTKRILVPSDAEGKLVKMFIQGNGNIVDVKNKEGELVTSSVKGQEGVVLQKKIFNLRAASQLAMSNPRNRQFLIDGLAAEKAGDTAKAHELFNAYLNATQVSFGVILPSPIAEKLSTGVQVQAVIAKVTTENGSLLTIDSSTLSVVAAENYGTATFDLDDFMTAKETTASEIIATEV